ncbi:MAG: BON domain-containing protein [Rudaea sp.]
MKTNLLVTALGAALVLGSFTSAWAVDPTPAATSNTASGTQDGSAQPGTDTWITTKVKTALMTTKGIPSTDISVTTVNGVVTLTGVVDTKIQVRKAIAVAKSIDGVHKVDASALRSHG